ncbi:MAG: arylsulfatase [Armatimonadota bacterium]|nr:arylsulfatase [Armatimonadota bacterium]
MTARGLPMLSRRVFLYHSIARCAAAAAALALRPVPDPRRRWREAAAMETNAARPNVILVLTDDQGPGDLGCAGNPVLRTPHLDRFHAEAVRFTNYHVGPTCAPTRAGLLTGHWANSTGVWHTIGGRSLLREDEWTLAQALRDHGYRTGIFGKWHLGDAYPYRPQDRGFDVSLVHGGGGISQTPDHWGNDYFDDTYRVNGVPRPFEGYCTDVFFREALRFIQENRHQPFFCYLATNAPHGPFNVEPRYSQPYMGKVPDSRARFYGMITCIDENFGRLRAALQEWGLEENTILIFMTDNGTAGGVTLDRNGFVVEGYNAGLRGQKGSPYDGGHRVPFFLRWPKGGLHTGRDIQRVTANVDVMPTLLELCGATVPEGRGFHGRSLVPLLYDREADWPNRALVTDSQRLTNPVKWRQSAVMTDRWRLVNGEELYDVVADREQRHDISAEHPDVVARLRDEYERWWEIVSGRFEEEIPILLGADPAKETLLTCHDWRNENCDCPWNHAHIRQGQVANGYWEVRVERSGEYLIELRRWPREANHPLCAGIEGDDISWRRDAVPQRDWNHYTGGKALPINCALLKVGGREYRTPVHERMFAAQFKVHLEAGPTHLQTWLLGEGGLNIGAYYVYVRALTEGR